MTAPVPCVCRPAPVEGQQHSPACRFQRRDAEQHECMGAQALNADWHCRCFLNIERPCCRCGHDGDEDGVCPVPSGGDAEARRRIERVLDFPTSFDAAAFAEWKRQMADAVLDALGLEQVGWLEAPPEDISRGEYSHEDFDPHVSLGGRVCDYGDGPVHATPVYRLRVNGDAS